MSQDATAGNFWGSLGIGSMGSGVNAADPSGSAGLFMPLGRAPELPNLQGTGMPSPGLFASARGDCSGSGGGNPGSGTGVSSGFGSSSPRGEGRNAFTPGDRTWWKLPPLPDPSIEDACIAVSDWLTQIQPIMSDLSDRSLAWWQRVMEVAQKAYLKWQQAGPLEKSLVVCDTPADLLDPRLSRLEARALGMILESLPVRIKDELVVTKALTSPNAIFRILLAFQPGGLGERQKLISNLQEPGSAMSARHCSDQLRRWHRWFGRSQDLGVNPPDPAILLTGLDKLSQTVIAANPQVGFRCNISRTQHQLDFCPTVGTVTAYARLLQAEMETLALSGSDPDLEDDGPKLTKKQRAAALRKEQAAAAKAAPKAAALEAGQQGGGDGSNQAPAGKGGQGGGKGQGAGQGTNAGGVGGAKGSCRFYSMKGGCKMGRNCWSYHDFGKASAESRCFNCGATDHRADACTRPKERRQGKGEDAPRGESSGVPGGKGNGSNPGSGVANGGQKASGQKGDGKSSQVRQVTAEEAPSGSGSALAMGEPTVAKASENSSQELIAEATKLLKGFRIAAVKVQETLAPEQGMDALVSSRDTEGSESEKEGESFYLTKVVKEPLKGARGLLDGGATNALRRARSQAELDGCSKTQVSLALGQAELFLTPVGTLLSVDPVSPIVPMGVLAAELHCKVCWEGETCTVTHPTRGRLPVIMVNRCPELCAKITEELISEIEDRRARMLQRALRIKALGMPGCPADPEGSSHIEEMLDWLRELSPDCPEGVLARVPPLWKEHPSGDDVPLNRRVRRSVKRAEKVVIHLFSGKTKAHEFGHLPSSIYVLSIDLDQGADILSDGLYQYLVELCTSAKVVAIIGGPPCSTLTRLRERGEKDGGPKVLRDRSGLGRFGTLLRDLTKGERNMTNDHTVMYFHMFLLHHIAHEHSEEGVLFVLENPMDPAEYLSDNISHASIWAWPELRH